MSYKSGADRLLNLIEATPGKTELQLAQALYGRSGIQQQVNPRCRLLVSLGLVERRGVGGPGDPFTYYPTPKLRRLKEITGTR